MHNYYGIATDVMFRMKLMICKCKVFIIVENWRTMQVMTVLMMKSLFLFTGSIQISVAEGWSGTPAEARNWNSIPSAVSRDYLKISYV